MVEEQFPDGLDAEGWLEMKPAYQEEYETLGGLTRPRKTDKERLAYLRKWFAPTEAKIEDGDVFKHYMEQEYYVVTGAGPDLVWYYVHHGSQHFPLETMTYQDLRAKSVSKERENVVWLIGQKWEYVTNIGASW